MRLAAEEILGFWLDEVGPERWFAADPDLDPRIAARFGPAAEDGLAGVHDRWILHPRPALALMILRDQFPRNLHRGSARAYRGDARALALAKRALSLGHDLATPEPERQFFYLPLMHSEALDDQERCVRLMLTRMPETGARNLPHAIEHRAVIRRFGRFPHRNRALGRRDSPAEAAFLATHPGF